MKKISINIVFLVVILTTTSCVKKTEHKNFKNMKTESLEEIRNIYKNIRKFDYNPIYQLKVTSNLCTYEIFVNDVLADDSFSTGRSAGEQNIDIPQYILKSGIQSITVKVYPKAITNGVLEKMVDVNADLKVRVVYGEYYKQKFDDFKEVFKIKLPKIGLNLPLIQLEGKFKAEVPYELKGWSGGVDLSKEDAKKLQNEILTRMKEIALLYKNKDINGLAKEQYQRTKEIDQSMYLNTKENSAEWIAELKEALNESKNIELLDGEMIIMGNGKLVTLLIKDGKFRNQGVIRSETEESYNFFPQYFYRPNKDSKLEIIR